MLKGRTAVITGSTSGIGLGIARELAAAGVNIVLNGLSDPADIEHLRAGIADEHNVKVIYSSADISNPEAIGGMIDMAQTELGGVDIMINNAGIQFVAPIEEFPIEKWNAIHRHQSVGRFSRHSPGCTRDEEARLRPYHQRRLGPRIGGVAV